MKTILVSTIMGCLVLISSCKKEKNSNQAPSSPTVTYTKGILKGVTILSIPNSSLLYDSNGADVYWNFWANADTSTALISGKNSPLINVQDNQFPLVKTFSTGYPVFYPSGTVLNSNSGTVANGNYYIKVYDEDMANDAQSADQYIGMLSFTWNDLISNTSPLTKTMNGTAITIIYTLQP
ncbi:MAG: hypothetical protein WAQ28_11255 [Bacteroidia bacterium]